MATCLDALVYNTEREQGLAVCDVGEGKRSSPIFHHPGQKKVLLDMFARTLAGRALTLRLTEVRDAADRLLENELASIDQAMKVLGLSSIQQKRIADVERQLSRVDRQLAKVEPGRRAFGKDPGALAAIEKERRSLLERKASVRAALRGVSSEYLALLDRAVEARRHKEDEEAYAAIYTSLAKAQVTDDRTHPAFSESLVVLARSLDAVERFRNAMTLATPADRRNYRRRMLG